MPVFFKAIHIIFIILNYCRHNFLLWVQKTSIIIIRVILEEEDFLALAADSHEYKLFG